MLYSEAVSLAVEVYVHVIVTIMKRQIFVDECVVAVYACNARPMFYHHSTYNGILGEKGKSNYSCYNL